MAMTNVFTGAHGTLFMMPGNGAEGDDAEAILNRYDISTVGRVTGVEVYVHTELEEYHEIGRRHATSLHPGNIHLSGKIGRAYINGTLLYLLLGRGASPNNLREPYVQPELVMNVILDDPAVPNNRTILDIYGVKFENWSQSLPEDDFVMENITFKALRINVRDEDSGNMIIPEFEETSESE